MSKRNFERKIGFLEKFVSTKTIKGIKGIVSAD
jgi:hypothetical protein